LTEWEGYPNGDTWEPEESFEGTDILSEWRVTEAESKQSSHTPKKRTKQKNRNANDELENKQENGAPFHAQVDVSATTSPPPLMHPDLPNSFATDLDIDHSHSLAVNGLNGMHAMGMNIGMGIGMGMGMSPGNIGTGMGITNGGSIDIGMSMGMGTELGYPEPGPGGASVAPAPAYLHPPAPDPTSLGLELGAKRIQAAHAFSFSVQVEAGPLGMCLRRCVDGEYEVVQLTDTNAQASQKGVCVGDRVEGINFRSFAERNHEPITQLLQTIPR
jgi:hypothetical protein